MNARMDGIHFGTGEDLSSGFFDLAHPESPTVINEPEAQWHYAGIRQKRPNAINIWRASPATKPADVGWSAHVFSRSVFRSIDAHHDRTGVYPTDILLLNELNLDYERGDAKNDGGAYDTNPANWPFIYSLTAGFLDNLLTSCKERATDRGFRPRWWFPGWAPGHGEYRPEIAKFWVPVAKKFDSVCFTGDQLVTARGVRASSERLYEGDLVTIKTAHGDQLTVTANHPVLTRTGWIPARLLHEGSEIAQYRIENPALYGTNDVQMPTPISEVHRSLHQVGATSRHRRAMRDDFHGDGFDSDVDIVRPNRLLRGARPQSLQQLRLMIPQPGNVSFNSGGFRREERIVTLSSPAGTGSNARLHQRHASSYDVRFLRRSESLGFSATSSGKPSFSEGLPHVGGTTPEEGANLLHRLSGQIRFVHAVDVHIRKWRGHVYNLSTADGLIVSSGIITHNCLHSYTDADTITSDMLWYLQTFPDMDLLLGEWDTINLPPGPHSQQRYDEEVRIRSRLQALGRAYKRLSATYFIHAWEQDASHEHDIQGDDRRTAIWSGQVEIPYDPWEPGPLHPPIDPPLDPPGDPIVPPPYPLGIDVSNNNGFIDWSQVAASGVQFAIAKITEGTNFRDGWFSSFWPAMKANGLRRGAYHFARPSRNGAIAEANYFVDAFAALGQALEPGDVVALDLEDELAGGDLSAWTLAWCRHVEWRLDFKPLVYSSPGYISDHRLQNAPELGEFGLWCASWGVPTPPPAPVPWDLVAIHQYAVGNAGTIPGVSGQIDLNRFNGSIEQFSAYGMPGTDPVPSPPPSAYVVGEGILTEMQGRGSEPASNEIYAQFWSEAMDIDGRIYRYLPKTGRVSVYTPE